MLETLQNFVAKVQQSTASSWLYSNQEIKTSQPTCCWRSLQQYTLAQVAEHCHFNDCWLVVYDKVYDVTHFLREHPGGEYIVLEHAGRDATIVFRGSRHSKDAYDLLEKYCIGILAENERLYTPSDDELLAQEMCS